jgi:predicted  nucleic acid-binding Zn-ribbon protein
MSNADFFSLFPAEDPTPATNADGLTQLFAQNSPGDNGTSVEADLDDFALMFEEILLDGKTTLETMGADKEQDHQAVTPAVMAIAEDKDHTSEFIDMEWNEADNGLATDLGEIVTEIGDDLGDLEDLGDIDDQGQPSKVFVHSLTPPFLQSYQTLQAQVAQLTEQRAIADQQIIAHQRRGDSAEALIHQQATELTQAQEHLSHTVAELKVHQEEAKRQQLRIETLTQQLNQSQTQLTDLSDQLTQSQAQLTHRATELADFRQIAATEKQALEAQVSQYSAQITHLEKHVEELQHRLQRQQRYALQYKSALEQCLAQPDFHPSSDISQVVAQLTGKMTDFQPWVSVGDVLAAFPQSLPDESSSASQRLSHHSAEQIVPRPFSVAAEITHSPQSSQPEALVSPTGDRRAMADPSTDLPDLNDNSNDANPEPRARRPLGPDTLSFAVREQKKAPHRPVELPNFLARAVSVSR